jgi:multimeric flavodoxin WrbA
MAKKILFFCGSPRRNGNTNTLVEKVAREATAGGARVEIIDVPSLKWNPMGCTGCLGCQKSKEFGCVIGDGAAEAVAKIPQADVIVMATPIYFGSMTGQLKCLVDRTFSLVKVAEGFRLAAAGRQFALIATAGSGVGLEQTSQFFGNIARMSGKPLLSLLVTEAQLADSPQIDADASIFAARLLG